MKNQTSSWKTRQVHEKVGIKFWQLLIFELKLIKSFLILTLRLILTFISRIRTIATVCPVLSWLGLAWPVLFRPNLACPVLAWPVLAWPVLFRPNLACTVSVLTWLVLSNPVLFRPILSCPVLSYLILSNSVLFFSILSYSVLFSPILSCPALSLPFLSWHVLPLSLFTLSRSAVDPMKHLSKGSVGATNQAISVLLASWPFTNTCTHKIIDFDKNWKIEIKYQKYHKFKFS